MDRTADIRANIENIHEKIEIAAARSGRAASGITLIAVTKTVGADRVEDAFAAGIRHFGENKAQELVSKRSLLSLDCTWHFIGHLQSNKVLDALANAHLIHSVDSLALAQEISRQAVKKGMTAQILAQINISNEETKSGVEPGEAAVFVQELSAFSNINVLGLMTIARPQQNPEDTRPDFRKMKKIFDGLADNLRKPNVQMKYLSMGMSHDFEVAIEEGSNIVRVGTAIFGQR